MKKNLYAILNNSNRLSLKYSLLLVVLLSTLSWHIEPVQAGYITNASLQDVTGPGGNVDKILYYGLGDLWLYETFTSVDVIDTVWKPTSNPGIHTNLIKIYITNTTGTDWLGFEFQLGYGTGSSFVPSTDADSLSFTTTGNTSTAFTTLNSTEDALNWSNGLVANNGEVGFYAYINVPDPGIIYYETGGLTFTLRQLPSVPIPGAIWLLGSGLIGLVGIRRKCKK